MTYAERISNLMQHMGYAAPHTGEPAHTALHKVWLAMADMARQLDVPTGVIVVRRRHEDL